MKSARLKPAHSKSAKRPKLLFHSGLKPARLMTQPMIRLMILSSFSLGLAIAAFHQKTNISRLFSTPLTEFAALSQLFQKLNPVAWSQPQVDQAYAASVNQQLNIDAPVVLGSGYSIAAYKFQDSTNSSYYLSPASATYSLLVAGPVGIGTTTPADDLEIYSASPVLRVRDSGAAASATGAYIDFGGTTTSAWDRTGYVGDASNSNTDIYLRAEDSILYLGDSTSSTVVTVSGGRMGIGDTTPSTPLDVAGSITTSGTGGSGNYI
ncbi:MAG TPA: hypothetical protein DEP87_03050, partial [Candidatus Pacebacteria bacterium]|nr:hypothetical protein [Candidatus Paceibacterota bacterium]